MEVQVLVLSLPSHETPESPPQDTILPILKMGPHVVISQDNPPQQPRGLFFR